MADFIDRHASESDASDSDAGSAKSRSTGTFHYLSPMRSYLIFSESGESGIDFGANPCDSFQIDRYIDLNE